MNWQIQTPARLELVAPSQGGKSSLILKLAKDNSVWDKPFRYVMYAVPTTDDRQSYIQELNNACSVSGKELKVVETIPTVTEISAFSLDEPVLLIVDDVLAFPNAKDTLTDIAVMHSHHRKISLCFSVQNPFMKSSKLDLTTLSRNLTGRFVFYQVGDWYLYSLMNQRLFPDKKGFLLQCLQKAKHTFKHPYIFINVHPFSSLPRRYIAYTGIFADERSGYANSPIFFDLDT